MKTKLTFFTIALVAMLATLSCGEQDFANPNAASEESASVGFLAVGIESGMRIDLDIYLQETSIIGRDAYFLETADPRFTTELLTGPLDANGFLLTRPWAARYRIVKDCNVMIGRAAEEPNAELQNGAAGFAKTILAYQLLLNLNLTDTNGIRVDVASDPLGPIVDKPTALASIAGMLDEAAGNLSAAGSSFRFTLSSCFSGSFDTPATFRQFNRALRARVAAYQSDWNGVMNALSESFLDTGLDMQFGVFHCYSTGAGDQTNPIFEPPDAPFVRFLAHPSFETDAEPGDLRFSSKTVKRTVGSQNGLSSDVAVSLSKTNTDPFPIIRNEELILLRAEANINMGNLGPAQNDLNVIRTAAGLGDVTLTDQGQAITQMLHERRYSLWVEGHRWIDMRRYDRLGELPLDRPGDVVLERFPLPTNELTQN